MTRLGTFQGKTTRTSLPRESFRPLLATALSYPLSSLFHLFSPSKRGPPRLLRQPTPHTQYTRNTQYTTTAAPSSEQPAAAHSSQPRAVQTTSVNQQPLPAAAELLSSYRPISALATPQAPAASPSTASASNAAGTLHCPLLQEILWNHPIQPLFAANPCHSIEYESIVYVRMRPSGRSTAPQV